MLSVGYIFNTAILNILLNEINNQKSHFSNEEEVKKMMRKSCKRSRNDEEGDELEDIIIYCSMPLTTKSKLVILFQMHLKWCRPSINTEDC